jgi:hypothetical protein
MKSFLLSVVACCFVAAASLLTDGCADTAATKAVKTERVIITSVNIGVKQIVNAINAGKLTQKQCDQFKAAYVAYTDAQKLAKAAIEKLNAASSGATTADVDLANAAVADAETALLAFINSVL